MADGDHTPRILVDDRQDAAVDLDVLIALAAECLTGEGAANAELSVSFVTEEEMADLHVRYMAEEGPTDVLSFPLDETDEEGVRVLGDVVIAPAVAARNNPADPASEMRLLLVHGILHLLGHDHEQEGERVAMWAIQERYTGVSVP
jgi:probable rRNA maturation factor